MRMQTDKGFTLVELMVAAALTTALFLLVIPFFKAQSHYSYNSTQDRITNETIAQTLLMIKRDILQAGYGVEGNSALAIYVVNSGSTSAPDQLYINYSGHLNPRGDLAIVPVVSDSQKLEQFFLEANNVFWDSAGPFTYAPSGTAPTPNPAPTLPASLGGAAAVVAAGSQGVIPYQGWFQYTGGNITLYGVPSGVSFPHKPTSASTTTTGNASIGAFIYATAGLFYPAGAVDVDVDNVVNNIATPVSVYGTEGTTAQVQVSGENIEGSTGGVGYSYQDLTFGSPFLGGTTIPATSLVAPAISYKVINNAGNNSWALFRNRGIGCSLNATPEPWKAPLVGECRSITGSQTVRQRIYASNGADIPSGFPGFRVRCQFVDKSGVSPPIWCGDPADAGTFGIGLCIPSNMRTVQVIIYYQNLQKGAGSFGGTIWGKYRKQQITASPRTLALN